MFEALFASLILLVCVVLLLRLCLGARRQAAFDAAMRRTWYRIRQAASSLWHWRRRRQQAAQSAEEAIRRASRRGQWDGNVYKPERFRDKPRKPH